MKKKLLVLLLALALVLTLCIVAIAADGEDAEAETITISYIRDRSTMSNTTNRDGTAYKDGKQTVVKGEKFTLPTASNESSHVGEDGYQLFWYTEDGQTFKGGEEVSFDKDTKLFRSCAKEVYTASELGEALCGDTKAAVLMANIEASSAISFPSWSTGVIIMNGFDITFRTNESGLIGEQRTQRHFYGKGTINVINPDGKVGEYFFLRANNHGYAGDNSRTVIGRDVTINAPNHYLTGDNGGDIVNRYVWTRIYGTINCYGLFHRPASNNCGAFTEFYEGCNVTFTGKQLVWDANSNGKFNYLGIDIAIYGGTFYLPADAANQSFWTNDYVETMTNPSASKTYTNVGLTQLNKDNIKIYSGSFVTADGSVPAIAEYIQNTYTGAFKTGGNGITSNSNTSTYEVPYIKRPGIKLEFTTYSASSLGTIKVTDYVGSALAGKTYKYTVNKLDDGSYEIIVYESRMDGETEVWDVVSDELALKWGNGGTILVSYDLTSKKLALQNFEANNQVYQTVVPADCDHSFTGSPVDASCQHKAYADYNCSKCGYNAYFTWGKEADHAYEVTAKVDPTTTSLGSTTFTCSDCGQIKTYATTQDPTSIEVAVTIKNDDGSFENITALASDVFEFSANGANGAYMYTLTGIKAFGEYSIRNIYGVKVPCEIRFINIQTQNLEKYENADWGLEVLEIAENSDVAITNIGNLSCLKTFKVGKGTTIVIEKRASYYSPSGENRSTSKLETVDFSAGDMNVKVMANAFHDRPIKNLLLGDNSTYDFQSESFRNIKATELEFPSSITFLCGSNAFRDADFTSLKFSDGTAENINTWKFGSECFRYAPITSVTFGQYGTYTIENCAFANLKLEGTLEFAPNSTYSIQSWSFFDNNITVIDFSAGNMNVTVTDSGLKDLTNVTEFKFGENSKYVFNGKSLGKTLITKFVLAPNSSYTFNDNFLENNTTIEELDASADNITIVFNARCFNGRSAFKTLTFGKNANLTFSEDCFKGTAVNGLELGENYTLTFGSYSMRNFAITELNIKKGSTVTFGGNWANGSTIEAITFAGDSNYTFNNGSFNYDTKFTELVFQENTTCRFKDWALNGNSKITKIDLSASGVNVTLDGSALRNAPKLTEVLLNGNNATYVINNNAFRDSKALTTVRLDGEGSTYTINGSDVFYTTAITELALGKNSTYYLGQWLFTGSTSLQKFDASADGVNVTFEQHSFRSENTLTELLINGKNATYTFKNESFRECSGLKEIVLGEGSTYNFNSGCFNSTNGLTKFDGSASGITANIGNNVFDGKTKIAYIAFGENSSYTIGSKSFYNTAPTNDVVFASTSTFSIGQEAFRYADFASITFEDNCNVTFAGAEAFRECDKATKLYLGKNIAVKNYPFKYLKALEELYIMEGVTHASEWEFEHAGSSDFSTPLYVYNHSYDFVFNKGLFNNCDGIFVYTVTDNIGTNGEVFANCGDTNGFKGWTVYLGIPHPELVNGRIEPSCEENGYITYECNCGYDCGFVLTETTVVNKYENKHNITAETEVAGSTTYEIVTIDPTGHDKLGEIVNIVYESYLEKGTVTYVCSVCEKEHDVTNEAQALFEFLGYATNEERTQFSIGYIVNVEAIEAYEAATGNTVTYGVVGAITSTLDGKAPLEMPDSIINTVIEERCPAFDFIIKGFKEDYLDLGMTMSAYVIDTDAEGSSSTAYIQSEQTDNPTSYTLGEYIASLPPVGEDEEEAA